MILLPLLLPMVAAASPDDAMIYAASHSTLYRLTTSGEISCFSPDVPGHAAPSLETECARLLATRGGAACFGDHAVWALECEAQRVKTRIVLRLDGPSEVALDDKGRITAWTSAGELLDETGVVLATDTGVPGVMAVAPGGEWLATVSQQGELVFWSRSAGRRESALQLDPAESKLEPFWLTDTILALVIHDHVRGPEHDCRVILVQLLDASVPVPLILDTDGIPIESDHLPLAVDTTDQRLIVSYPSGRGTSLVGGDLQVGFQVGQDLRAMLSRNPGPGFFAVTAGGELSRYALIGPPPPVDPYPFDAKGLEGATAAARLLQEAQKLPHSLSNEQLDELRGALQYQIPRGSDFVSRVDPAGPGALLARADALAHQSGAIALDDPQAPARCLLAAAKERMGDIHPQTSTVALDSMLARAQSIELMLDSRGATMVRTDALLGSLLALFIAAPIVGSLRVGEALRSLARRRHVIQHGENPFLLAALRDAAGGGAWERLANAVSTQLRLNHVAVQGGAFSGKTDFLAYLSRRLAEGGLAGAPVVVARADLLHLAEKGTGIRREIAGALASASPEEWSQYRTTSRSTANEKPDLNEDEAGQLVERYLAWWGRRRMERPSAYPLIVLIVDHFEACGEMSLVGAEFLRRIAVNNPPVRMVAASRPLPQGKYWANFLSGWFRLDGGSVMEVGDYLRRHLTAPFSMEEGVVHAVHGLTSGHPLRVWTLAAEAVEVALRRGSTALCVADVLGAMSGLELSARGYMLGVVGSQELSLEGMMNGISALRGELAGHEGGFDE